MTVFTGIIVYILTWWITIFAVLPIGHKRDADGTTAQPQMKKKLIMTTIIATIIWLGIYAFIESDLVSFQEMTQDMKAY